MPVVLVADDEPLVRLIASELIRDLGYEAIEAANGFEALRLLETQPGIAVLFTDIRMPGLDGFALAERARALKPDLKVIFATGYADMQNVAEGARERVLTKPFRSEHVREALANVLRA